MRESGNDTERLLAAPFAEFIGLKIVCATPSRVVGRLDCENHHQQLSGLVHAGVYTSIVETLASMGGRLQAQQLHRTVVGVHNSTDFLRPHRGGPIEGVAKPLHIGRSQQLWAVVITSPTDNKILAHGKVRLRVIEG